MKGPATANFKAWLSGRHRVWLLTVPGILALLLLLMALVPFLFDANVFRPLIEKQIAETIHRPVRLGNLTFSLFTASLVADDVVIGDQPPHAVTGDDPPQATTPLLEAAALRVGVEAWPLLLHKHLVITRFVADEPHIHLVRLQDGTWNFSSFSQGLLGAKSQQNGTAPAHTPQNGTTPGNASVPGLAGAKLQIRNGTVTVEGLPGTDRPLVYQHVEVTARHVSAEAPFPFQASMSLPAGAAFTIEGRAGPLDTIDIANTPFNAGLAVRNLDPVAAGLVEPTQGIRFVADVSAKAASDGHTLHGSGTVHASHLQLARNGTPSAEPVDATFDVASALSNRVSASTGTEVQIHDLAIKTGRSAAHMNGTVTLLPSQAVLHAKVSTQQLPLDDLQNLLPSIGVRLPRGATLHGGTVTANLSIHGPAKTAELSGHVDIENTSLTGFNLGSRLNGLATLSGIASGDSTAIQTLRTEVVAGSSGIHVQNLYAALPAFGTASGAGTISSYGALDFHLLVKLNSRTGSGSAFGIVSTLGGLLGRTASPVAAGIPVSISGTQADPQVRLGLPLVGSAVTAEQHGDKGLQHLRASQLLHGLLGSTSH